MLTQRQIKYKQTARSVIGKVERSGEGGVPSTEERENAMRAEKEDTLWEKSRAISFFFFAQISDERPPPAHPGFLLRCLSLPGHIVTVWMRLTQSHGSPVGI